MEVKSKVGAGDSFLAGFVLALSHGQPLESAVRLGTAAGTAAVMHEGTQLCRKEDVERLMGQITITPLKTAAAPQVPAETTRVRDVVCGMRIMPARAVAERRVQGKRYVFCSTACAERFDADPARYASAPDAGS